MNGLCKCTQCAFYASGEQYSSCILPNYLERGFQMKDADKVRHAVEDCHCKSQLLADLYETVQKEQFQTISQAREQAVEYMKGSHNADRLA